jgi:hypothetical protein
MLHPAVDGDVVHGDAQIRAQVHQVQLGKITSLVIVGSACWPVEVAVDLSRAAISGFCVVGTVTGLSRNSNDTCR